MGNKRNDKFWEVAFYGWIVYSYPYRFTTSIISSCFSEMLTAGIIDGIRCSTRPDAVGDEAITLLQSYGVKQ